MIARSSGSPLPSRPGGASRLGLARKARLDNRGGHGAKFRHVPDPMLHRRRLCSWIGF